jgi:alkylation response protein AidB-like acyl-CoA dehydrogenase
VDAVLAATLAARPPAAESLAAWWAATEPVRVRWASSIDRALVGGGTADRLGFAFAGGYAAALRALVPGLDGLAALCATEVGGNQPRAIKTTLVTGVGHGTFELNGHKKWATMGPLASTLLVVATTGVGPDGRNRLVVARVRADTPGVRVVPAPAPFVPEIPHAEVDLVRVQLRAADLLPGDGYTNYVKPFRTVEDLHVHAALIGYLIGVATRHALPRETIDELLALAAAIRGLAGGAIASPALHLALAGALALVGRVVAEVERAWAQVGGAEWERWQRDRTLVEVAGSARAARRERAWSVVGA